MDQGDVVHALAGGVDQESASLKGQLLVELDAEHINLANAHLEWRVHLLHIVLGILALGLLFLGSLPLAAPGRV